MQDEITRLVGRDVYSNNGVFVGEVEDVQLETDDRRISGVALGGVNDELFDQDDNKGVIIPYRWVSAVGDIIIIKDIVERLKARSEEGEAETT
ncbi:MAG: PRC-barrel domain-containing protein [Halobacteria archaeon]|nr:PRC-barrel domain-containing protein [Halobacteria archaeon]